MTRPGEKELEDGIQEGDAAKVAALIAAGVDVNGEKTVTLEHGKKTYSFEHQPIDSATSPEVAKLLLDAGADPGRLTQQARRALVGLPPEEDEAYLTPTLEEFERAWRPRFGRANPERCDEPFWLSMIRSGVTGYQGRKRHGVLDGLCQPTWCAQRFGQSLTFLPDGRAVQIAGEHEDWSDPDFCIYNDVFVHAPGGEITIYTYPEADFPPTDFHTATLVGDFIYVIGSLGYMGTRRFGETPVYRLDVRTFSMERVQVGGAAPGWIHGHRAALEGRGIRVWGGKMSRLEGEEEVYAPFTGQVVLDLDELRWRPVQSG
jgi:hypothetical protein